MHAPKAINVSKISVISLILPINRSFDAKVFSDWVRSNVKIVTYAIPWIPTITDLTAKPIADSAHSATFSTLMPMLWKGANGVNEEPMTSTDKRLAWNYV